MFPQHGQISEAPIRQVVLWNWIHPVSSGNIRLSPCLFATPKSPCFIGKQIWTNWIFMTCCLIVFLAQILRHITNLCSFTSPACPRHPSFWSLPGAAPRGHSFVDSTPLRWFIMKFGAPIFRKIHVFRSELACLLHKLGLNSHEKPYLLLLNMNVHGDITLECTEHVRTPGFNRGIFLTSQGTIKPTQWRSLLNPMPQWFPNLMVLSENWHPKNCNF